MCRASNISKEPIVPTPSTMTVYDPKGTHWASYTTTQHGPTPVTAAAAVGSVKGRVAATAIGKWQQVKKPSVEVAMRPLAGPPSLIADALRAVADGRYWAASRALQKAASGVAAMDHGARKLASSKPCPTSSLVTGERKGPSRVSLSHRPCDGLLTRRTPANCHALQATLLLRAVLPRRRVL